MKRNTIIMFYVMCSNKHLPTASMKQDLEKKTDAKAT